MGDRHAIVDVARALGISHGSVYRHLPSKAALRDAVTERWLARIAEPLEAVAAEVGPATGRLTGWLNLLAGSKRRRAVEEPELFATYLGQAAESREVVRAHVETARFHNPVHAVEWIGVSFGPQSSWFDRASARSSSRKSGCAIAIRSLALSETLLPKSSAMPHSVTTVRTWARVVTTPAPAARVATIRDRVPPAAVDGRAMIAFPCTAWAAPRMKSIWPPTPLYRR